MTVWTPEITRARYVEAAHTEQFIRPTDRLGGSGGYWPQFFHDEEDKAGWDDAARLDNAEKWRGRASTGAISRHQECMEWTAELIEDETRRHIVWAWAFCRANDWDFGARCNRRGWARPTAYRRLAATIEQITINLNRSRVIVRIPGEKWLRHETEIRVPICASGGIRAAAPHAIKFTKGYRTEPSRDLIQTQEQADTFAKFLERRNARLRKLQAWRNERVA